MLQEQDHKHLFCFANIIVFSYIYLTIVLEVLEKILFIRNFYMIFEMINKLLILICLN